MTDVAEDPSLQPEGIGVLELTIRSRLERGRMELLDLSTRNRLINTPRRSKQTRTIEVVDELSTEIHRLLVQESRVFTFVPGRLAPSEAEAAPSRGGDGAKDELDDDFAPLPQPDDDGRLDERGIASKHLDTKLQTQLTSSGLQNRLLSLYYDARTFEEEQGVNILYLALGMLKWFEAPNSETERFAPLILVPVALDRGNARERFKLRWTQDDLQPNLSLAAMLRREHGIILPEFDDDDAFDLADYSAKVASAVSSKPRWEVLQDDVVLGFFSFAKFLMYRDLDPVNWPEDGAIDEHLLVSRLLGDDGFTGSDPELLPIGDDDPVDPHVPPAAMVHIVDADSSQTVAIEEARHGRILVIQGPPGTGKSQTIANVIAAAVADGKRVLFVAEKMAALEVVKRRLDNVGVGDICLELHSNKSSKRAVLEELKRTWALGRPRGADDRTAVRKLESLRERLNAHPARLHRRHEPLQLSPYQVIGHLVRLQRAGLVPSEIKLLDPETWTHDQKTAREEMLLDLRGRIAEMGLPTLHPWHGVGLDVVLRMDIDRFALRIASLRDRLRTLLGQRSDLQVSLRTSEEVDTDDALMRLAEMGTGIAAAPPDADFEALADPCWDARTEQLEDLVATGITYAEKRSSLDGKVSEAAWTADVGLTRQYLAAYGASWLRWLRGDWRRANASFRGLLAVPPPKTLQERLRLLDSLIAAQRAAADLVRDEAIGQQAFGTKWRREKSDWTTLSGVFHWTKLYKGLGFGGDFRRKASEVTDRDGVGRLSDSIKGVRASLWDDLDALARDLRLDVSAAFTVDALKEVALGELLRRLELWHDRAEELTKWIAYRVRAGQAVEAGLGEVVERLADGRIAGARVIDEFEMAFYEAILRAMVATDSEIACFDGDAHERLVQDFRTIDRERIELARLEVAGAHHEHLPKSVDGIAAGPLGVLRGEIVRKRGHMPIRKLMKRAGPVIQALKPVFMMSPLSVAQFLEPGAVTFDLLVIDEASQIQPVDALGAIARCDRMVVVGDDRQLPPTRFFAKMTGEQEEDAEEDGAAGIADIESILGLCTAKGVPTRMLRWHYRSKHQSLIAVSNSQFYENKLYVVPSPWTQEAGMGLRFNHVPGGVFDSGNTAVNAIEAKAVAEAIMLHARTRPDQSLGVATFSVKQRRAIQDELERLRRVEPETEEFFTKATAEPFFVKNLENIQGDERDVILISVGYARNPQGYMAMRFGPLSAEGGERRLNVLISRAKRRCEVFASITDEDIDLERGRGKGVAAFKLFLHFARTGKLSIGQATDREHDSIFEEQVADALRVEGYDVRAQIGLAGFFVDLAVADPEKPGRYVIGIECDGASYHSSRSARDRDRLRQAVLEDHGWIIHRIWSTDWFQRPQEQLRRTIAAIEAAKAELASRPNGDLTPPGRAVPVDIVTIDRAYATDVALEPMGDLQEAAAHYAMPYREASSIPVPLTMAPHEVTTGVMAGIVQKVVAIEGPVHRAEIVARVRTLWGLHRAGNRVQAAVQRGLDQAISGGLVDIEGDFYSLPGDDVAVRDRSAVASTSLRKPEMLPPAEIRKAVLSLIEANFGATVDETMLLVSRVFGFKATSTQLRDVIGKEIDGLLSSGILGSIDGVLRVPSARMVAS